MSSGVGMDAGITAAAIVALPPSARATVTETPHPTHPFQPQKTKDGSGRTYIKMVSRKRQLSDQLVRTGKVRFYNYFNSQLPLEPLWVVGMRVEIQQTAEGLVGAWYRGEVVTAGSETAHVRYDDFFDEEGARRARPPLFRVNPEPFPSHALCAHRPNHTRTYA